MGEFQNIVLLLASLFSAGGVVMAAYISARPGQTKAMQEYLDQMIERVKELEADRSLWENDRARIRRLEGAVRVLSAQLQALGHDPLWKEDDPA